MLRLLGLRTTDEVLKQLRHVNTRLRRALGAAGRGSASSRAEELCPALPALLVALAVVRVVGGRVLAGQREAAPRRRGLWPKPRPVSSVATRRRAQC